MAILPSDIETAARQKYNATNDTFYSTAEFLTWIFQAECALATEGYLIERVYTSSSTNGQQEYPFPTSAIAIKRVTYNGNKLHPIQFRDDDALTMNNSTTTASGTATYYSLFNRTMYFRPIPDADGVAIKVFCFSMPQILPSASTALDVDDLWALELDKYCLIQMAAKDQNWSAAQYWQNQWDGPQNPRSVINRAKAWKRRMLRADGFTTVVDEDTVPGTIIGGV
jgi:hypothetical protein